MSEVQPIADLVSYQAGSVVSRTLIKKSAGTLTIFAFDKDEALSEHTTPYDAPLIVLDGEAEVTLAGVVHRVRAGEMLMLPANVPHAVKAVERFKMMLVMVRG